MIITIGYIEKSGKHCTDTCDKCYGLNAVLNIECLDDERDEYHDVLPLDHDSLESVIPLVGYAELGEHCNNQDSNDNSECNNKE